MQKEEFYNKIVHDVQTMLGDEYLVCKNDVVKNNDTVNIGIAGYKLATC